MTSKSGFFDLGDFEIAGAGTQTGTSTTGFTDTKSIAFDARLEYGSSGTTIVAVIQTSLNQGSTWIDIARFDFTTSGAEKVVTLTSISRTSPLSVAALGSEGANDGIFGDRYRAVITSTGTYTNSTVLAVRMDVKV